MGRMVIFFTLLIWLGCSRRNHLESQSGNQNQQTSQSEAQAREELAMIQSEMKSMQEDLAHYDHQVKEVVGASRVGQGIV